jgi:CBS domain-containing protein
MISIANVMTPRERLVTLPPDATVREARRAMSANGIRHIPILEGDRLVGLVSQTDLLVAHNADPVRVRDIMVRDLRTVDARANVRHAAMLIQRRKVSSLPVMRNGRIVGIVTDSDFVGIAIALMEQLEEVESEHEF